MLDSACNVVVTKAAQQARSAPWVLAGVSSNQSSFASSSGGIFFVGNFIAERIAVLASRTFFFAL